MFEVGFSELLLIMGLALLVLGPEKLPKVVGEIGRWMGRARAMARQFREQLEEESLENTRRRQADAPAATETYTTPPEPPPFMDATGTVDDYLNPTATGAHTDSPQHTDTPQHTETPPQDERRA